MSILPWVSIIFCIASIILSSMSISTHENFKNQTFMKPEKYFKENVEFSEELCKNYFEGRHVDLPELQSLNSNLELEEPTFEPDTLPPICKKLLRKVYKKDYDQYRKLLKIQYLYI
jgi:cell shape-determining protein MreC